MSRIVFMGTPTYARTVLERIWDAEQQWMVVTKPDSPQGRRHRLTPSPVAEWALDHRVALLRPTRLAEIRSELAGFNPEIIVTAAFGLLLPGWLLALPPRGAYNLHASLLPRWRGANPIAWAIRSGDAVTGVTLMRMDVGLDTGPIVATTAVPIGPEDTTGTLTEKLARAAARLWNETWRAYPRGAWPTTPQPDDGICWAPKFTADEAHLRWDDTAEAIHCWVRSLLPDPGPYVWWEGVRVKILRTEVLPHTDGPAGWVHLEGDQAVVGCQSGSLRIWEIQPSGRRPMAPGDFVRGLRSSRTRWRFE